MLLKAALIITIITLIKTKLEILKTKTGNQAKRVK